MARKTPTRKKTTKSVPKPPKTHNEFVKTFPKLGEAWEMIALAGREGPLDERTVRLIKLAVSMAALREGAVHSNVRRALAEGISAQEIEQVVALTAGTLGMPSTAAVFTWVRDVTKKKVKRTTKKK